jgi:hypothetical protein
MNNIYSKIAVWCRPVVRCTTWYTRGDMKLWYVVQGKDSRTATLDDMRNLQWPQDAPALHLQNVQCLSGIHRIEVT